MSKKTYYLTASAVFAAVGLLHLLRVIQGWEAVIAGVSVPMWFSWAAVLLAGYLSVRGWQFAKKSR